MSQPAFVQAIFPPLEQNTYRNGVTLPRVWRDMFCALCLLAVVEEANVRTESWKEWGSDFQGSCHPERERRYQGPAELAATWHWVRPVWGGDRSGGVCWTGMWHKKEVLGSTLMCSNIRFRKTTLTAYLGIKPRCCLLLRGMEDTYI